jgi:hypothetical protein
MSDPDRRQLMEWLTQQSMEREPQRDFEMQVGDAVMHDEPAPQYEVGEAKISQIGEERFNPPIPESAYAAWRGPIGQQAQPEVNVEIGEAQNLQSLAPQDAWAELENSPAADQSERLRRR